MDKNEERIRDEEFGKLAYQTYYKLLKLSPDLWDMEPPEIRQIWMNVAKAVAEPFRSEIAELVQHVKDLEEEVSNWRAEAYAARGE